MASGVPDAAESARGAARVSLKRNALANYIGQAVTTVMGLAFIPLYIKFLGIEGYGLIGIFALLQTWLSLLDLGMTPAISREMARYSAGAHDMRSIRDLLRSIEICALVLGLLVAVGIAFGAGWLATSWLRVENLSLPVVTDAFVLMGAIASLRFLENIYRSALVGLEHQVRLNVVSAGLATARGVGAVIVLAFVSRSIAAFFLWQGFVSLLSVVLLGIIVHRSLPPSTERARFSWPALQSVWKFATGTILVTLLGFVLSQSDKLILSKLLPLKQFAIYSLAYSVASAVRLLTQPVDQAVFPRLTQLYHQKDEAALAHLYHKSAQFNAVCMGGVGLFLAIFGERVLALWTQDPALARNAYAVLWILLLGMVLNGIMNGPYYLQMAAGWTGLLLRVNAVMVCVFLPTIYVLTRAYGMTGAAAAWVLLNFAYVVIVARLMHQRLLRAEMWAWYVNDLLLPLSAGVVAGVVLKTVLPSPAAKAPSAVILAFALFCILIASAAAAALVRRELTGYLRPILARSS